MRFFKISISVFLFLFFAFQANAQKVSIKWKSPIAVLDKNFNPAKALYFDEARIDINLLPHYIFKISNVYASEFNITNAAYIAFTEEETKLSSVALISGNVEQSLSVGYQNGRPVTMIDILPVRVNASGAYEKLISFEYTFVQNNNFSQPQRTLISSPSRGASNARTTGASSITGSVLSSGAWYKIAVASDGIFKMDYNFFKNTLGINPDNIDPRQIRMFGNAGGMLPQANITTRVDDLLENTIYVPGESDGKFDATDYVLFYGKGPDTWKYNSSESIYNHTKNLYSDKACYFITIGPVNGLRVQDQSNPGGGTQIINVFDDYSFIENDLVNLLTSGREWYGDVFDISTSGNFSFTMPGLLNGSNIKVTSALVGKSNVNTSFSVSLNNVILNSSQTIPAQGTSVFDPFAIQQRSVYTINAASIGNSQTFNINLTYNKGSSASSVGYLNYLEVNAQRILQLYGTQTIFRSRGSQSAHLSEFVIGNVNASALIWDVTNLNSIKNQQYQLSGSQASYTAISDSLEEYVVFSGSNFSLPSFVGNVPNQNLHGITGPYLPDMVIVTPASLKSEADRLANFRKSSENLDVFVATIDQVYNEFSSGAQDVTAIRDFMKMLYDRKSGNDSIRYLLLFGSCSYDYKDRISGNTNLIPVYESRESLNLLASYSSDDYFAFLDNTEGYWDELNSDASLMDIGVGRIVARNDGDAKNVVDKMIRYKTDINTLGKWKNRITFVADDGDGNIHQQDADDLATKVDTAFFNYNTNKIYMDAYPKVASPGGETSPIVKQLINEEIERGTFIMNYSGHGGEFVLAQEAIVDINQLLGWANYEELPLIITATCDFGRYDDPAKLSGGELALTSSAAASALITSARVVYQFSNKALNLEIYNYIFKPLSNGQLPRMGDVIRQTKNTSTIGVNNRNYALLGDPSMMLAYPLQNIAITKIKGNTVTSVPDTMKALSHITIEGEVRNKSGTKLTDFNGVLSITVFDKKSILTTLGTNGNPQMSYTLRNNLIFDGSASVKNGDFSVNFIVPKDISYQYDFGKISVYAEKTGQLLDAAGNNSNIIVGGTDTSAPADNTPPLIHLFMNDESFVFGGLTGKDALFLAKLSDESGINTAGSGIGHEITADLDNTNDIMVLNQFYSANLDDYKNGAVKYPFKDLSQGTHTLRFKAWDTYNNSSEAILDFIVANDDNMALNHVLNFPNPFSSHTTFHFDHNRVGDELDIMIQVYSISGKLVKTLETRIQASTSHFAGLDWDGRDDYGDAIGKGVYVYKVNLRSPRDGNTVFKFEKLVILN